MGLGHVSFDGFVWLGAVTGVSVICEARPGALVSRFYGGHPGGLDREPRGGVRIVNDGLSSW